MCATIEGGVPKTPMDVYPCNVGGQPPAQAVSSANRILSHRLAPLRFEPPRDGMAEVREFSVNAAAIGISDDRGPSYGYSHIAKKVNKYPAFAALVPDTRLRAGLGGV